MRKLHFILFFLLSSLVAFGQYPNGIQTIGNDSNVVAGRGAVKGRLINWVYFDTTAANSEHINQYPGAQIFTLVDNSFWLRDRLARVWLKQTSSVSSCQGLQRGTGLVSWDSLLVFTVAPPAIYCIDNTPHIAGGNITLNPADPSLNRLDIIAVDTNNNVIKITGVPATNPAAPQINPASQIALTTVFVPAGSLVPGGISSTIIYNENIEWSGIASGVTTNFNNTLTPYLGLKATDVGAFTDGNTVSYTNISSVNAVDYSVFKMYINLRSAFAFTANIQVFLTKSGIIQTQPFVIDPTYNFRKNVLGVYQNVSIPMSAFVFRSDIINSDKHPFDGILIKMTGANANGYLLDWIQLQSGISQGGNTGDFVTQNYASNDTLYYVKNGVNYPFYFVKKDSLSYVSINKINDSTFSLCRRSALCDTIQIHSTGSGGGGSGGLRKVFAAYGLKNINDSTLAVDSAVIASRTRLTNDSTALKNFIDTKEPIITASNTQRNYWNGYKQFVALNTDSVTEGTTNKFYTDARARLAISTSAPVLYNNSTGVISVDTSKSPGKVATYSDVQATSGLYYPLSGGNLNTGSSIGFPKLNTRPATPSTGFVNFYFDSLSRESYVNSAGYNRTWSMPYPGDQLWRAPYKINGGTIADSSALGDSLAAHNVRLTNTVQSVANNTGGDSLIVIKNGVRTANKYPSGGAGTTNVDSTIRSKNLLTFANANAFGDSYTAGYGLPSINNVYVNLLSSKYGFGLNNYGISASTINMLSFQNYKLLANVNQNRAAFIWYGFNDVRGQNNTTKLYNKIGNAYRAAIANQFLNLAIPVNDASVTKTGSWTTLDTWPLYAGKAKYTTTGGLGETTTTTNDQLSYTTASDNIVIGYIGFDGIHKIGGKFLVTIGSLIDTVDTNNQTDGIAQAGDSTTFYGISCVKMYSGLGTSSKNILIKNLGGEILIDYFGTLKTNADSCKPVFATSIQKVSPFGFTVGLTSGSSAIVDKANERIKYIISETRLINKNYPIFYVDVNKYINYPTDLQSDSLHWNSTGHNKAFISYSDFLNRPLTTYFAIDQPQTEIDIPLPGFSARTPTNSYNFTDGGMRLITTGSDDIGTGLNSLQNITTGTTTVAYGNYSGQNCTSCAADVFIGHFAGNLANIASSVTAVGNQAARNAKRTTLSTYLGASSGASDTSGTRMTGTGVFSASSCITCTDITSNGAYSFNNLTDGLYGAVTGTNGFYSAVHTQRASGMGYNVFYFATGNDYVGGGFSAGQTITTGSRHIVIGSQSTTGITTGNADVVIGGIIQNLPPTLSNTIVLGDGDGNIRFWANSTGISLGGNRDPSASLQLQAGTTTNAPLNIPYYNLVTTAASGTGTVVTLTFATQSYIPFSIGSSITVSGVTPSSYNGTFTVTGATSTTVTYSGVGTGSQTVAGSITQGALRSSPKNGDMERNGSNVYFTDTTNTRYVMLKGITSSATLDFTSTTAQTSTDLTVTVTGALDGDNVIVTPPNASVNANSSFSAWVSAANTVTVRFNNYSTGTIDPASGIFKVTVLKW